MTYTRAWKKILNKALNNIVIIRNVIVLITEFYNVFKVLYIKMIWYNYVQDPQITPSWMKIHMKAVMIICVFKLIIFFWSTCFCIFDCVQLDNCLPFSGT